MEYNQEILDRLHGIELEILQDFIRVCEENDLTWWAFGGAGIGALRHGGFIPWDDDIDVCLMRGDYEKLAELFREQYPDKYLVVNLAEYATCPFSTTRIMLKDSRFLDIPYRKIKDCPFGIFLDVYAFDNVAPTDRQMKRQAWKSWFYDKLIILSAIPFPVLPFRGIKGKLRHGDGLGGAEDFPGQPAEAVPEAGEGVGEVQRRETRPGLRFLLRYESLPEHLHP